MNETDEIAQIYNKHRMPSLSGLSQVTQLLHRANIGGVLNVRELNAIKRLIQIQNQYKTFYNGILEEDEEIKYPILNDRMEQLPVLNDLFQEIHQKCDAYDLFDNASYELQGIRSKISSTTQRIKQNLDKVVKSQSNQKNCRMQLLLSEMNAMLSQLKLNIAKILVELCMINQLQVRHYILNHHQ